VAGALARAGISRGDAILIGIGLQVAAVMHRQTSGTMDQGASTTQQVLESRPWLKRGSNSGSILTPQLLGSIPRGLLPLRACVSLLASSPSAL